MSRSLEIESPGSEKPGSEKPGSEKPGSVPSCHCRIQLSHEWVGLRVTLVGGELNHQR